MIPVRTRDVKIERDGSTTGGDEFDAPSWVTLYEAVPAHIGSPGGSSDGDRFSAVDMNLYVDQNVVVPDNARVTDLATGEVFSVKWSQEIVGLGGALGHRKSGINRVHGAR